MTEKPLEVEALLALVHRAVEEDPALGAILERFGLDQEDYAEALSELLATESPDMSCSAVTTL